MGQEVAVIDKSGLIVAGHIGDAAEAINHEAAHVAMEINVRDGDIVHTSLKQNLVDLIVFFSNQNFSQ